MRITNIKAIQFDAVGTLLFPVEAVATTYARVGRRHGSRLEEADLRVRFAAAFQAEENLDEAADWQVDEARELERWRRIVARVLDDATDPGACFDELYRHYGQSHAWRSEAGAEDVLAVLHNRGFQLALASNFDSRLTSVLAGLPIHRWLPRLFISSAVGWRKPSSRFFHAIANELSLVPEDILVVGDDLRNDYQGARAAGSRAMLYDPQRRNLQVDRLETLAQLLDCIE